jgi:hypothetical protein
LDARIEQGWMRALSGVRIARIEWNSDCAHRAGFDARIERGLKHALSGVRIARIERGLLQ